MKPPFTPSSFNKEATAKRLVIILKPSSNSTRMLFMRPRAVTLQSWPFRPQRFQ
jgi:hypothetical protein